MTWSFCVTRKNRNNIPLSLQTTLIIWKSPEGKWLWDFSSVTAEETEALRGIMGLQDHTVGQRKDVNLFSQKNLFHSC